MDELWRRCAAELAALIAERQVTSREVIEAHLARIDEVSSRVNAVTATMAESTRFILPANVLGLPAVAIPVGIEASGPTSVQIYADLWREDLCLDAAQTIEDAAGALCPIDPVT